MKKEWNGRTVFFLAMAMTLICFLPFLIRDKGLFIYFGDYNMQQVPFYLKIHEAVRNGHFFWDMTTQTICQRYPMCLPKWSSLRF